LTRQLTAGARTSAIRPLVFILRDRNLIQEHEFGVRTTVLEDLRRVRVDDHLPKRVVGVHFVFCIDRDVAQQLHNGRYSGWVDPVLRLLQAEDSSYIGILGQRGENQEAQCPSDSDRAG